MRDKRKPSGPESKRPAGEEPSTERRLFELCVEGDERAWAELLARYQRLIYSVPIQMGLSQEDADDVFQQVCSLLYTRLRSVRDPLKLPGWLVTTAKRESWLVARRARRSAARNLSRDDADAPAAEPSDPRPLADTVCAELERAQALRSAMAEMPERCRLILGAFLDESQPADYTDVARRLGLPRGSLGPTRARCLALLRELLKERGIDA
jgi:RNA polymerase sigma factor (sigma-70 family)